MFWLVELAGVRLQVSDYSQPFDYNFSNQFKKNTAVKVTMHLQTDHFLEILIFY